MSPITPITPITPRPAPRRTPRAATALVLLAALATGAPVARADDEALLRSARDAYRQGVALLDGLRALEGEERQRASERALAKLRAAQETLEPLASGDAPNATAEAMLTDVQALLYWTIKMTPLAPEVREEAEEQVEARERVAEEKRGAAEGVDPDAPPDPAVRERDAADELARIRAAEKAGELEGWPLLARYFRLADRYGDTRAGVDANGESMRLQRGLWGADDAQARGEGDWDALPKAVTRYLRSRKRSICEGCDGAYVVTCKPCRGTGWIYRYYPGGLKRPDWNHTKPCACNPEGIGADHSKTGAPENGPNAGRMACRATGCYRGFNLRHLEDAIWEQSPPAHREKVRTALAGLEPKAFVMTVAALLHPDDLGGAADPVAEIAARYGVSAELLRGVAEPRARPELARCFAKWERFEVTPGKPVVRVELQEVSNGRVIKVHFEELAVEWDGDAWYVVGPR